MRGRICTISVQSTYNDPIPQLWSWHPPAWPLSTRDLFFFQRVNLQIPPRYTRSRSPEAWLGGQWSRDPIISQIGFTLPPILATPSRTIPEVSMPLCRLVSIFPFCHFELWLFPTCLLSRCLCVHPLSSFPNYVAVVPSPVLPVLVSLGLKKRLFCNFSWVWGESCLRQVCWIHLLNMKADYIHPRFPNKIF